MRGVGKTTTARILARALNYELPDGSITGPTVKMPGLGVHCRAIMESRHIESSRWTPPRTTALTTSARSMTPCDMRRECALQGLYSRRSAHALSAGVQRAAQDLGRAAWARKFIFATTEIRKVPVTILSRCQRFDLRRIDAALLVRHLSADCRQGAVRGTKPEALALDRAGSGGLGS